MVLARTAAAQSATLNIAGVTDGDGTVTSSPAGINCTLVGPFERTGTCVAPFAVGTVVTLTGTPAAGNSFDRWIGLGCGTSPTCQFTVSQNSVITPKFEPTRFPLTIVGAGTGGGEVVGIIGIGFVGQPEIHCVIILGLTGNGCMTQYPVGKPIILDREGRGASDFGTFGAPCTDGLRCRAIMPAAPVTIVVTFKGPGFRIEGAGTGSGRVTSTGSASLNCTVSSAATSGTCRELYVTPPLTGPVGPVSLTAVPSPGSRFVGFSGKCVSSTTTCQFSPGLAIDSPPSLPAVTATFALESVAPVTLSVGGAGTGSGTVTSTPAGVSCTIAAGAASGTCAPSFPGGTEVALQATPNAGSTFTGWTGGCSGTGTCSVTLTAAQSVTAQFTAIAPTIVVTGTGSGTVSSSPAAIACTITNGSTSGTCSAPFASGSAITFTATPAAGWVFAGWGGDCAGTGACQPNATANRAIAANFARATVALKITGAGTGDGTVKAPAAGLTCPVTKGSGKDPDCTVLVAQDVAVTLTADPQGGSVFAGWSGDVCSGAALTCTLTVSQARNVVAQFRAPKPGRDIAQSMLGRTALPADEALELDRFGNKDGKLNLGDLLALLDRTGERLAPATAQALLGAERRPNSQTPTPATRRTP